MVVRSSVTDAAVTPEKTVIIRCKVNGRRSPIDWLALVPKGSWENHWGKLKVDLVTKESKT